VPDGVKRTATPPWRDALHDLGRDVDWPPPPRRIDCRADCRTIPLQFGALVGRQVRHGKLTIQGLVDSIAHRLNHLMGKQGRDVGSETSGAQPKSPTERSKPCAGDTEDEGLNAI
jgi:hypothetical protein